MSDMSDQILPEISGFGSNPGNLRMFAHIPASLKSPGAVVVALHGCGQTCGEFAARSGWLALADELGFVLVAPQQKRENNVHTCFNWFQKGDITRNSGEAASIRQMVEHVRSTVNVDARRIYVTGFSAGGAMANVMLATCPEIFEAGAIVAGLPYGATLSVSAAVQAMAHGAPSDPWTRGDLVRTASPFAHIHPRISVWHGLDDTIVNPVNANEIIAQWRDVHGISGKPLTLECSGLMQHRAWGSRHGKALVELNLLRGVGHGVPVAQAGEETLFDVCGIDSTSRIAGFFGLGQAAEPHEAAGSFLARALQATWRLMPRLAR